MLSNFTVGERLPQNTVTNRVGSPGLKCKMIRHRLQRCLFGSSYFLDISLSKKFQNRFSAAAMFGWLIYTAKEITPITKIIAMIIFIFLFF
jgi:hypothetical protein